MKFWQLISIVRTDKDLIFRVASTHAGWKKYASQTKNFSKLVATQDRAVLDSIIEKEFVIAVLKSIDKKLYLTSDGWLRSYQEDSADQAISILDSFLQYGGDKVEGVLERGAVTIP